MSKKKKRTLLGISIAFAVGFDKLSYSVLSIWRYNLWYLVVILIITLIPTLFVFFRKNIKGDRLFDYFITIFCVCFSIYSLVEIIYLEKAPTNFFSSEITNAVRSGRRTYGSSPGYRLYIDGHFIKYRKYISESEHNKFKNRKLDSTLYYAHGEYRYGFISTIQIRSFDLEIIKP